MCGCSALFCMCRVGQNLLGKCTVYSVISMPKVTYICTVYMYVYICIYVYIYILYMVLADPKYVCA